MSTDCFGASTAPGHDLNTHKHAIIRVGTYEVALRHFHRSNFLTQLGTYCKSFGDLGSKKYKALKTVSKYYTYYGTVLRVRVIQTI